MFSETGRNLKINANDIIYTPKPVALIMIKLCKIKSGSKVYCEKIIVKYLKIKIFLIIMIM